MEGEEVGPGHAEDNELGTELIQKRKCECFGDSSGTSEVGEHGQRDRPLPAGGALEGREAARLRGQVTRSSRCFGTCRQQQQEERAPEVTRDVTPMPDTLRSAERTQGCMIAHAMWGRDRDAVPRFLHAAGAAGRVWARHSDFGEAAAGAWRRAGSTRSERVEPKMCRKSINKQKTRARPPAPETRRA